MEPGGRLPVHGFVLAGGKSSRMGRDKALATLGGQPLVAIAVEKLRGFCAQVSIVGEREDLAAFAAIVRGERADAGPAAGIEAGLRACEHAWAMFVPVDVPLVPGKLLRLWTEAVICQAEEGCGASFLLVNGRREPAFCMVRRDLTGVVSAAMDAGERRIDGVLFAVDAADNGWLWAVGAERFAKDTDADRMAWWFRNVNTEQDLAEVEAWTAAGC